MKLVVGLGNPGRRYAHTRHNLGFRLLDRVADARGIRIGDDRCESLVGRGEWERETLVLAKPQTYMNHSGLAAAALLRRFRVQGEDLVVVYDDLDLPLGRLRVRCGGSAGGHRGLASILQHVAERDFVRLRLGIGRPPEGVDAVEYVLGRFSPEEQSALDEMLARAAEALETIILKGPVRAMEDYNRVQ